MLFSSLAYALLVFAARTLSRWTRRPGFVLLLGSVVFYVVAGPVDSAIFFGAVLLNWGVQYVTPPNRIRILLAVLLNIGLLAFFKYKGIFLGETAGSFIDIALPLGISFYSFQALAYHIDVVRGDTRPARSLLSFALFKGFFPQLVAGPIVRAKELLPQVEAAVDGYIRKHPLVSWGLLLCLMGLVKKVILADSLSPFVDDIFQQHPGDTYTAWLGALLFAFQIYFDFSGYSDIALGSAYLLGFRLPVNFRTPYVSLGPREFWRRWHVTLSRWIQDYLYIPLGGSRGSALRTAMVLVMTMSLAGLWHGANATFVIWGLGWGLYILCGRLAGQRFVLPWPLRWTGHIALVTVLWVFFRSPSISYAFDYVAVMFGFPSDGSTASQFPPVAAIGVAALFLLHWFEARCNTRRTLFALRRLNTPFFWGLNICLAVLIILVPLNNENPFIYFRF